MDAHRSADGRVRLRDGRLLGFSEWGDPYGSPVLYFHGAAGSPLEPSPVVAALLERARARWIVVHRPGFGWSDPSPERRMAGWPEDVEALADALELDTIRIVGVSAGAPYALATAAFLPRRVHALTVVSSVGPARGQAAWGDARARAIVALATRAPGPVVAAANLGIRTACRHPRLLWRIADHGAPGQPNARAGLLAAFESSTRNGAGPIVDDLRLVLGEWDFELSAVACPVTVWHGRRDGIVPLTQARRLAAALPNARINVCSSEGHFFFRRRLGDILASVAPPRQALARAA